MRRAEGFSGLRLCWGTVKVSVENMELVDAVPWFRKLRVHPGRNSQPGSRPRHGSSLLGMVSEDTDEQLPWCLMGIRLRLPCRFEIQYINTRGDVW